MSILAPPGTYAVRLTVGTRTFTQPLEIRKDPNSGGSEQEIAEQTTLRKQIQADLDSAVVMINTLEGVRAQAALLRFRWVTTPRARASGPRRPPR